MAACPAAGLPAPVVREWTIRTLGRQPYEPVWRAMQRFTDARGADGTDELWVDSLVLGGRYLAIVPYPKVAAKKRN